MNVPFHALPPETQMQVVIACIDMTLVPIGRFLQMAVPLALIAMTVFLFLSPKRRRRWRR